MEKTQMERVVDGRWHERVVMVRPPKVEPGCAEGRHCACHGDGPFFCCTCGAMFDYPQEGQGGAA